MTWLTWRQFRAHAVTALTVLVAFAVLLVATRPHMAGLYTASRIAGCTGDRCEQLANAFLASVSSGVYPLLFTIGVVGVVVAPIVIGIFWGAPLVAREFETGTFRFAWVQSVTRTRWLVTKLALPGMAAMAVTEGLSLMYGWWAAPISQAARLAAEPSFPLGMSPFSLPAFAAHGIAPLGYAAFAFTLGVATGALVRRALLAMAITLAVFAVVQVVMPLWVRPHLFTPDHTTTAIADFSGSTFIQPENFSFTVDHLRDKPGVWILSSGAVDAAGHPVSAIPAACRPAGTSGGPDIGTCLANQGIRVTVTYEPTSRYWPMQLIETAIYLALAVALSGFCFWRLRRRRL